MNRFFRGAVLILRIALVTAALPLAGICMLLFFLESELAGEQEPESTAKAPPGGILDRRGNSLIARAIRRCTSIKSPWSHS